ncbi:hypothetical protein [Helicobacter saguini]|uniref:Uncharacterized protein n=1 Tax=Helicobacter saguini TaxID=1548018 RepID=A0A6L7D8D1_9HELI|nr:hypothetical protein [Helicobacter saguini]MWV69361.1 hypothetical protein [Helicobacter saguini]
MGLRNSVAKRLVRLGLRLNKGNMANIERFIQDVLYKSGIGSGGGIESSGKKVVLSLLDKLDSKNIYDKQTDSNDTKNMNFEKTDSKNLGDFSENHKPIVIFDVGANIGKYTQMCVEFIESKKLANIESNLKQDSKITNFNIANVRNTGGGK